MGLKMKTLSEILEGMISWTVHATNKITDFSVGSVIRTTYEAVALQLEEFYFKIYEGFKWAVENSIFKAFGFELLDETYATGTLTIEFYRPLTSAMKFNAGMKFCTAPGIAIPKYYVLTKDVIAPVGASKILVPIQSTLSGTQGNTTESSVTIMINANTLVSRVYNVLPILNGREKETLAERKTRFQQFIKTLARGTTDAIIYGASQVEGVNGVYVDDSIIGLVKVYVHDVNGDLSEDLKARVITQLRSYRAAGVEVQVLPVIKNLIDVNVEVIINKDYDPVLYRDMVDIAVKNYMNAFQVNQGLYVTNFIKYLGGLDDLAIVSAEIHNPSANIPASKQTLLRPGVITVTIDIVQ